MIYVKYFIFFLHLIVFVFANNNSTNILPRTQPCDFECDVTVCFEARLVCYSSLMNDAIGRLTDVVSEQYNHLSVEFNKLRDSFNSLLLQQTFVPTPTPVESPLIIPKPIQQPGLFSHSLLARENPDTVVRSVLPSQTYPFEARLRYSLFCWLCFYEDDGITIQWCTKHFDFNTLLC